MKRILVGLALLAGALVAPQAAGATPAGTQDAAITGSGSSWAADAVNQFIADTAERGPQVYYVSTGSAQGRKDFGYGTTDFGITDLPYQGTAQSDTSNGRAYRYLPIAAGAVALPYHLVVKGALVRNLRLSALTVARIFTNKITYWDDKEITSNNHGRALPHIKIIPVVHSDGSGASYNFTRFLATAYPGTWRSFTHAGASPYFPRAGAQVAMNGSDGVMNFVTSSAGQGSIGYDEYSYALSANYPSAKIENRSGYFTAPTWGNVAVSLQKTTIDTTPGDPGYLTASYNAVYSDTDRRAYPLSFYSYLILPSAANDVRETTATRQALAGFVHYAVCQGQGEVAPIGYAPLPLTLTRSALTQLAQLKVADPSVDLTGVGITTCSNPTFTDGAHPVSTIERTAPEPMPCDKAGAGPC